MNRYCIAMLVGVGLFYENVVAKPKDIIIRENARIAITYFKVRKEFKELAGKEGQSYYENSIKSLGQVIPRRDVYDAHIAGIINAVFNMRKIVLRRRIVVCKVL